MSNFANLFVPAHSAEDPLRPEVTAILDSVGTIIKGKRDVAMLALAAILARGHVLFEDVPGTGKTTLANLIAATLGLSFNHVQMTNDMLPSDILGSMIFDPAKREFEFHPGPIFANVVMADELNRTSPRTQSALLEAMGNAKVTVDRTTHRLPVPFTVLATQNPREVHGTYPLPTSQLDRFLVRLRMGYPSAAAETAVLQEQTATEYQELAVAPVVSLEHLLQAQSDVQAVKVDAILIDSIVRLAEATRTSKMLELGLSTRAALGLRRMAQAWAWMHGRDYVIPDDLKGLVIPVCAHRIIPVRRLDRFDISSDIMSAPPEELVLKQILDEFAWDW